MRVSIDMTEGWGHALKAFANLDSNFIAAANKAILQEAHVLRTHIIRAFTNGGPPGKQWTPHSPLTVAIRKAQGFNGTKLLIRSGTLRNSVSAVKVGNAYFVGVLRRAVTNSDGRNRSSIDIAILHEYGGNPIPITAKMRRFFFAMLKKAGVDSKVAGRGTSKGFIRIPPRPFLGPIFERYGKPEEIKKRFWQRVSKALGYSLGAP